MSDERAFLENLLNTRLGFLLLFMGIVASAVASADANPYVQAAILTVSTLLSFIIGEAVARSQVKLELIFLELAKETPEHPAITIDKLAPRLGGRRKWMGFVLPRICYLALAAASAVAWAVALWGQSAA